MISTTTWRHNFTNFINLDNINSSGKQHLEIFQPLAGKKIRLQLNNSFDDIPLTISSLTIYTDYSEKKQVTLNHQSTFEIEPRLITWSDWIDIDLKDNTYLSIDITSPTKSIHTGGLTISNDLIRTDNKILDEPKYFFGVSGSQIQTEQQYKRLAFFGDSLTNQGNFSAPLSLNLEKNYHIMTANYGLSGNRLLHPGNSTSQWSTSFGEAGLTRFDHMLIDYHPNTVLFMEGVNDLLHPGTGTPLAELPSANAVIEGIEHLKYKCEKYDIGFVPMTITPAYGNVNGNVSAWNEKKEALRLSINKELMKLPNTIDLASFVGKDGKLKNAFDCGDHVHLSAQGGELVAQYVEEQLIRQRMI